MVRGGCFRSFGWSGGFGGRRFRGLGGGVCRCRCLPVLSVLGRTGFTRGLRLALRGSRRCWGPADAEFLLHENLGEAEAAAGQLAGFVVREEFDPFFSDFSEEDLPGFGAEIINWQERAILVFAAGLLGLTAALVLVTAQAFLLAAGLFSVAAGLLGLAALLGGLLLSLGIAGRAGVALILPGRAGIAAGRAGGIAGEGLTGEGFDFRDGGGFGIFCHRGSRGGFSGGSFLAAGHRRFGDILQDFGRKVP